MFWALTPSVEPRSSPSRNLSATSSRASLGHSQNQSMVVQLTSAGYWRSRCLRASASFSCVYEELASSTRAAEANLKSSPTGLMHRTTCRLFRTRSIR